MKAYIKVDLDVIVGGFNALELNYQVNKEQIERYGLQSNQVKKEASEKNI